MFWIDIKQAERNKRARKVSALNGVHYLQITDFEWLQF